ncbi:putative endopeptidase Clp [Emiliania huxleyi CCMP1516]|uniref:ATP-dependent Clp protease proteolytic subunit n=2 Tax=Emiliania huxleyi TaxID=2903 RepID=A0A0D3IR32_EMIH1|nr:putative endopeptidase Clp [Emiliania huxleyi CCMP1516]EOD13717.1 putative endopeptidase Clp [Emiliania huxleyi CCMP1516]|eukprot:XP_005766146.1 putative endopeptidase Clp [Emiliania huxleyi CCMP1516]
MTLQVLPLLALGWSPIAVPPPAAAVTRGGLLIGASAAGASSGQMVDGARIGPPPDMPSMLLNQRIVYLGLPLSAQVTELIIGQLLYLQYDSSEKPITMYINSPGTTLEDGRPVGFETEAFAIADTMGYVKPPIHTLLVGKAYGLSALLLASGDKGHRSSLPYCTVMLHQPRGQMAQGQASDIAIKAREVLVNRKNALQMLSAATGQSEERLRADTNRCLYLDAQQAVDYGIVDKIIDKRQAVGVDSLAEDVAAVSRGLG